MYISKMESTMELAAFVKMEPTRTAFCRRPISSGHQIHLCKCPLDTPPGAPQVFPDIPQTSQTYMLQAEISITYIYRACVHQHWPESETKVSPMTPPSHPLYASYLVTTVSLSGTGLIFASTSPALGVYKNHSVLRGIWQRVDGILWIWSWPALRFGGILFHFWSSHLQPTSRDFLKANAHLFCL